MFILAQVIVAFLLISFIVATLYASNFFTKKIVVPTYQFWIGTIKVAAFKIKNNRHEVIATKKYIIIGKYDKRHRAILKRIKYDITNSGLPYTLYTEPKDSIGKIKIYPPRNKDFHFPEPPLQITSNLKISRKRKLVYRSNMAIGFSQQPESTRQP